MKSYAKIVTACLVIAALMVNSVSACWLFARRARCQPCWTPCYSAPVVYDSCGMPSGAMSPGSVETLPAPQNAGGEGTTIMSPSMRMPWTQPQPGRTERRELAPAETRPPRQLMPSERSRMDRTEGVPRDTGRATAPADRTETRREPMPEPEPMPPPRTEPPRTEPSRTEPGARANDNPFESPSTTEPREPAPPRAEETRPMPKANEDDPFAPRPTDPSATRPAERTPAADDPFGQPQPSAAPLSDPFAPRSSSPPSRTPADNPFSAPPDATKSNDATKSSDSRSPIDNAFAPRTSDATPATNDPFAPRTSAAKPPADDPFAPPSDAAKAPMSEVKEAPMSEAKDAGKDSLPSGDKKDEPAKDNPFAEPVGPRLSIAEPAPEPADAMRVWTDATGKHQVRGQMAFILVAESKVRILKETGKYTTVPFAKLSEADRTFVAQHSSEPSLLLAKER